MDPSSIPNKPNGLQDSSSKTYCRSSSSLPSPLPLAHTVRIQFEVSDNGIGMVKEAQQYIFKRFSQVDNGTYRQHNGTGLGLYMVKHLVKLMNGPISCMSEQGQDSTFTLDIGI